jgi:hypothetical protein
VFQNRRINFKSVMRSVKCALDSVINASILG